MEGIKIDAYLRIEFIREEHSHSIFNLVNNNRDYLRIWLPWVDLTVSVENTMEYIKNSNKRKSENNGFDCSIIWKNEIAGLIGLHKIDHSTKATSLGYWLGENYQGKGIMTKACKALTNHCFHSLNLNRVEIKCATENLKSQAIPERLNFKREGTIKEAEILNGKLVDHYLYSMGREEWVNTQTESTFLKTL